MYNECLNCEYAHIVRRDNGIGECYCYAQKNAPRVDALGTCKNFKIKSTLKGTKSRYSSKEIKNLQDKIKEKYFSHCNATFCKVCQYYETDTSCYLMFTLDYLNKRGCLKL